MRVAVALVVLMVGVAVLAVRAPAWSAPADPVGPQYAGAFTRALATYTTLGARARLQVESGLIPLGETWNREMRAADALLVPHQSTFFPMMYRPWTRETAVYSNLQGARMWLWSVADALREGAVATSSLDVVGGRVRAELLNNFDAYLAKASSLLSGGHFAGSYFKDTLLPILADYCAYPEDGKQVFPRFDNPKLFDDVDVSPAMHAASGPEDAL